MIAILHAPNRKASMLPQLMRKMKDVVEDYGLPQTNILVNPSKLQIGSYPSSAMKNVAIGWGETEKPSWDALIVAYDLTYIPHLMCFNLNERLGIDGKLLVYWPGITSEYWGRKVQRGQQRLFRDGYYVRAIVTCSALFGPAET
ncbi:MAG: hypothetical protein PHI97_34500 [Desulfobulbus sp.]|nr:hypothetical protein [Desulfobulbus sp.]